jgi:hypothetical protein
MITRLWQPLPSLLMASSLAAGREGLKEITYKEEK